MSRFLLHSQLVTLYFLVLGTWGLGNVLIGNEGPGIFLLVLFHLVSDTVWILVDPHLRSHRTRSKALHHAVIFALTVGLYLYPPWRLLISYASIIELSAFFLFLMKSFDLAPALRRLVRVLNIGGWALFRWAIPLYGALVWTRWWDLDTHGIAYSVALLVGVGTLAGLHLQWTLRMHRNGWEVPSLVRKSLAGHGGSR